MAENLRENQKKEKFGLQDSQIQLGFTTRYKIALSEFPKRAKL
jgi:hypothetical protein